jgi:uncharacterized protein (DUF2062 family)
MANTYRPFFSMPRKTIRRILPDFAAVLKHPSLRWTGPLIRDPNLLHINRESVSLGVFVGIFCAFIPLPGQTFIAAALALWLHANLPISVLTIWISNPVTIGPMFYLTHRFGSFLLGSDPIDFTLSLTWQWFSNVGLQILLPLLTGSLICGLFFASCGYFSINYLWRWKVISNWEKRKQMRLTQARK